MPQIIKIAVDAGYDGIELRFVEGEASLWKLAAFSGAQIAATKSTLADHGLSISCMDTSCLFHSPDLKERNRWIDEGQRMSDLAAELDAPAIRVFGDTIQPGASQESTRAWIAESVHRLAEVTFPKGIEVWIETHGDFCAASETARILAESGSQLAAILWDPVNSFISIDEKPTEGVRLLGAAIRHVHVKDFQRTWDGFRYVLTGEGEFPLHDVVTALREMRYNRFLSFEWEKKWHPELADASIALPHFAEWFRKTCAHD
jgi:sugar phosphate isomerase/epimerase